MEERIAADERIGGEQTAGGTDSEERITEGTNYRENGQPEERTAGNGLPDERITAGMAAGEQAAGGT